MSLEFQECHESKRSKRYLRVEGAKHVRAETRDPRSFFAKKPQALNRRRQLFGLGPESVQLAYPLFRRVEAERDPYCSSNTRIAETPNPETPETPQPGSMPRPQTL